MITSQHVSRVFSLPGLDHLVPSYPALEAATAAGPPAEVLAVVPGRALVAANVASAASAAVQ